MHIGMHIARASNPCHGVLRRTWIDISRIDCLLHVPGRGPARCRGGCRSPRNDEQSGCARWVQSAFDM